MCTEEALQILENKIYRFWCPSGSFMYVQNQLAPYNVYYVLETQAVLNW